MMVVFGFCVDVLVGFVLHFVEIVGEVGQSLLESLPLLDVLANLPGLRGSVQGISGHRLPMVKHALREGLATSVGAKVGGESLKERRTRKLGNDRSCVTN